MVFTLTLGAAVVVVGLMAPPRPVSGDAAAAGRLPVACDPTDAESCLYSSDLTFDVGIVDGVSLTDPARSDYEIPLLIRYPRLETVEPRPVVIWNHGGAPSQRGATRSAEWGNLLAAAGYVVIHPARPPLADPTPLRAECEANGVLEPDQCSQFVAQVIYGPQTTHFLIDHLADVAALDPVLTGLLDDARIVVAGHSAGSTVALANAGARQQFVEDGPVYDERNNTPIAFLATGVQGPMYAGFHSGFQPADAATGSAVDSFGGIDRPFMFITGVGDETGEPPESRTAAWLTAQGAGRPLPVLGHRPPSRPRDDGHRQMRHRDEIRPLPMDRLRRTRLPGRRRPPATRGSALARLRCLPRPHRRRHRAPQPLTPHHYPHSPSSAHTGTNPLLVGLTTTPPGRDGAAVDRNPAGRDGNALTALLIDDDAQHPLR